MDRLQEPERQSGLVTAGRLDTAGTKELADLSVSRSQVGCHEAIR